jgi:hypothetical protein
VQQQVLQHLQQAPLSNGPLLVNITHLINLQQQADEDDSSSSGQRWKKKSFIQKQLELLDRTGLQRLLWVTIHQPGGGSNPAAVFVQPWPAALDVDALHFSDGPSGQVSVLLRLQQRPDVGQQPMAVVENLRFAPAAAVENTGSISGCVDSWEAGDSSSSSSGCTGRQEAGDSSSSSSVGVYDYLVLCCGDFSPLEHENMFPNAMVHCGDGRQLHQARVRL